MQIIALTFSDFCVYQYIKYVKIKYLVDQWVKLFPSLPP